MMNKMIHNEAPLRCKAGKGEEGPASLRELPRSEEAFVVSAVYRSPGLCDVCFKAVEQLLARAGRFPSLRLSYKRNPA
jgi:hypothetical protein